MHLILRNYQSSRVNTYFSSSEEHHYQGNEKEELELHDSGGSKPIQESNVRCTAWLIICAILF